MDLVNQTTHRMVLRHHSEIGHLFVPNLCARIPNEQGGYYLRTNGQGFRSDWEFENKRGTRPRVLFLGDSFTAGDGCDNAQRYPERVGQALGVEVYNYGLPGSGTDQQLLVYETLAKGVEADLIVLGVYVENIERIQVDHRIGLDRNTGRKVKVPKPYFTLGEAGLTLCNVPVSTDREPVDVEPSVHGAFKTLRSWYRRHPAAHRMILRSREQCPGIWSGLYRAIGHEPYADYLSENSKGWRLMRALIQRLAKEIGPIPLLVVPIPERRYVSFGVRPRYQRLFESLATDQIHVADVTKPLCQLPRSERDRLYFQKDPHLSPFGNQVLAQSLSDQIDRRGLVPKSRQMTETLSPPTPKHRPTHVLGISCFYHDSAAALVRDGRMVAAAAEERFSRVKNDRGFPERAINYCLEQAGIQQSDLAAVVYYDNAALTFERLMHTALAVGREGQEAWTRMLPSWLGQKLTLPRQIRHRLQYQGPMLQDVHHRSHAASAFYPSPFKEAAILTVDGVGEWATASIGVGKEAKIELLKEMRFPHSLGLLYSAFTQFTGFKVNSGEYKMMGLAPYGRPVYAETIRKHLVDIKEDGSIELNMVHFAYLNKPSMVEASFATLFDGPARSPESRITRREMDLARSIQEVTEEVVLRMARHAHKLTGLDQLCMAGGVALNCVANGRLLREGPFKNIWIQPAAGDAGCALGAALDVYHNHFDGDRHVDGGDNQTLQGGSYWGPSYSDDEIHAFLETHGGVFERLDSTKRSGRVAELLAEGHVVGHFSGRMEFGPRALGGRSILGDPRNQEMQVNLNLKIKYRESFRPFAPSVLSERVEDYFELDHQSPYMLIVAPVREERRLPFELSEDPQDMLAIVRQRRSDLPSITHVDYSARVQSVRREDHPAYYDLIKAFEGQTGCGVVVNTSFNVRGEPIVCTPYDAYRCFMRTEMDALVLENFVLLKQNQPPWNEPKGHVEEHGPVEAPLVNDRLKRALHRIFVDHVVPMSDRLLTLGAVRVSKTPTGKTSTWMENPMGRHAQGVFEIPSVLADGQATSRQTARAIISQWEPGLVAEAFEPLLVKLLDAGRRHAAQNDGPSEVSQSMYVMY